MRFIIYALLIAAVGLFFYYPGCMELERQVNKYEACATDAECDVTPSETSTWKWQLKVYNLCRK